LKRRADELPKLIEKMAKRMGVLEDKLGLNLYDKAKSVKQLYGREDIGS
jgi:hypothetical protein